MRHMKYYKYVWDAINVQITLETVHFGILYFSDVSDGPSLRRLHENSVPTRIKLTRLMKKKQPIQYAFIERMLLNQPGVTNVEKNAVVVCEFDKGEFTGYLYYLINSCDTNDQFHQGLLKFV